MDPITLGLIGSGISAAYKGIQGGIQQRDARRALKQLEGQQPAIEVPAALRQRAQEPISEQVMSAQAEEQARRTGQSVGALQKAGARGILGGLGGVMDAERGSERQRMANYEQERRRAMGELGAAELDVQNRRMQDYLSRMAGATRSLEAGQQNIAGALDTVSGAGQQLLSAGLMGYLGGMPSGTTIPEPTAAAATKAATANGVDISGQPPVPNVAAGPPLPRQAAPQVNAPLPASAGSSGVPSLRTETIGGTSPNVGGGIPQVSAPTPRGLNRTAMEAPNMGGLRTGQMQAEDAGNFMDALDTGMGNIPSAYEPVQAPSARGLRRIAMRPTSTGLRGIGTPSEYARALQILNRI